MPIFCTLLYSDFVIFLLFWQRIRGRHTWSTEHPSIFSNTFLDNNVFLKFNFNHLHIIDYNIYVYVLNWKKPLICFSWNGQLARKRHTLKKINNVSTPVLNTGNSHCGKKSISCKVIEQFRVRYRSFYKICHWKHGNGIIISGFSHLGIS